MIQKLSSNRCDAVAIAAGCVMLADVALSRLVQSWTVFRFAIEPPLTQSDETKNCCRAVQVVR